MDCVDLGRPLYGNLGGGTERLLVADLGLIAEGRTSTLYSCSVLLSAILIVAGRYLPVKGGHAPADYE
jgi:hypothetical protein